VQLPIRHSPNAQAAPDGKPHTSPVNIAEAQAPLKPKARRIMPDSGLPSVSAAPDQVKNSFATTNGNSDGITVVAHSVSARMVESRSSPVCISIIAGTSKVMKAIAICFKFRCVRVFAADNVSVPTTVDFVLFIILSAYLF
jgi:hypothetical protein